MNPIIITVDGTGFLGTMTIGLMELPVITPSTPNPYVSTSQFADIQREIPRCIGVNDTNPPAGSLYVPTELVGVHVWGRDFTREEGKDYLVFARAESNDVIIGGAVIWKATEEYVNFVLHGEAYDG